MTSHHPSKGRGGGAGGEGAGRGGGSFGVPRTPAPQRAGGEGSRPIPTLSRLLLPQHPLPTGPGLHVAGWRGLGAVPATALLPLPTGAAPGGTGGVGQRGTMEPSAGGGGGEGHCHVLAGLSKKGAMRGAGPPSSAPPCDRPASQAPSGATIGLLFSAP